jgi:hypothetical protein
VRCRAHNMKWLNPFQEAQFFDVLPFFSQGLKKRADRWWRAFAPHGSLTSKRSWSLLTYLDNWSGIYHSNDCFSKFNPGNSLNFGWLQTLISGTLFAFIQLPLAHIDWGMEKTSEELANKKGWSLCIRRLFSAPWYG